ncbi:MAG: Eco57I restriction-modification methylase domain-containing protein, partial [Candidatus Kapabacteria bacterium]|nr:Eco57I restriction-modification methylase domain-containing protein [Candidatus Kapabacteria bacterium]
MNLADRIAACLQDGSPAKLRFLFGEVLYWGRKEGIVPLAVGAPLRRTIQLEQIASAAGVQVFLHTSQQIPTLTERRAIFRALQQIAGEHVVIYHAGDQLAFVWPNITGDTDHRTAVELRLLPYQQGSPARTTMEQLTALVLPLDTEPTLSTVRDALRRAFSVEAVTERFFRDYKKVFADLQTRLSECSRDNKWAHDYALQLLNRLMFLYFIQRKRWLGNNPRFLGEFWQAYRASGQPKDTFFDQWLSVLFFEAFNNKFHSGHRQFPTEIREALAIAPYLNGGLFTKTELDTKHSVTIPDDFFATLFDCFDGSSPGFLERYNFTVAESTPLDIEVAVDPEMIGKVYESLVNITYEGLTEDDLRGAAGIFYTPRVEIDLMCRLALVDVLANHLGSENKPLLYDAVFAYDPAEKEAADRALADENLWPELNRVLRALTVCDPACGSGSFLVGMLLVLDDLQARANAQLGTEETPYQRRRRIIGDQLYGVDVMDWAVHVAELRLWLQLVVETELYGAELHFRPLLPNLSFNIRCGDSLVQEIGGINFGLHRHRLAIPAHLKGRITQLKGKKLRFYQGEAGLRETELKTEELTIFRDILHEKSIALQKDIDALTRKIEHTEEQVGIAGLATPHTKGERHKLEEQWRIHREEKQAELTRIKTALDALRKTQTVPFVWDIAFVEIFEGEKEGFDIVIGNPPYVRQEMIAPPGLDPADFGGETSDRWKEQKKAYKAKLQESVAAAWQQFFHYTPGSGNYRKLDGKSDLYVYFYFHGLSLLNPRGTFCFITSNSWLDVGYGRDLQEFLLRHSHIKFILDNERKRSFAQADVNTVIVLLAPPDDRTEAGLDKTARFVMFKVPFEDVATAETFKALEAVADRASSDRWRITVRSQRELYEESLDRDEDDELATKARTIHIKTARYQANKWGGKYLRAPEIFFRIVDAAASRFETLGKATWFHFGRGRRTGADSFFYVEKAEIQRFAIERRFLRPLVKSPLDFAAVGPQTSLLLPEKFVFLCSETRAALKGT